MAEYIEREAAINWIYELIKARQEWTSDARAEIQGLNAAMCGIEDIAAADVQPVRHGRWSRIDYEPIGHDYICSVCGWKNDMASHYCPNCGAKMDGEA